MQIYQKVSIVMNQALWNEAEIFEYYLIIIKKKLLIWNKLRIVFFEKHKNLIIHENLLRE